MRETAIERIAREIKKIESFVSLLDAAEKQNCELVDAIKILEQEQLDLLHKIELESLCPDESVKIARRIQEIRRIRRAIKDTMSLWMPIKTFAKNCREIKPGLRDVIKEIESTIEDQENRIYKSRVNVESFTGDKHYDSVEIDIDDAIKSILKKKRK
jgi:hypothetical protein